MLLNLRTGVPFVVALAVGLAGCAAPTHYSLPATGGLSFADEGDGAEAGTHTAPLATAPVAEDEWVFELRPYFWAPSIEGNATVQGTKTDVDVHFSDIWDNLDFAALLNFSATKDHWTVGLDTIYLDVKSDVNAGGAEIDVTQETTIMTLAVSHPFVAPDTLQWFVGARYWNLNADLHSNAFPDVDGSKHWVDPIVGLKNSWELGEDWSLEGWADIGGFNVGSKNQWEAALLTRYDVSPGGALYFGYRALSVDYVDGNGADRFEFNSLLKGPIIGGGFRF